MMQFIWILLGAAAVGSVIGLTSLQHQEPRAAKQSALSKAEVEQVEMMEFGSTGSALATAAFGLSALQPETYNGELVLDIIDASHLDEGEKRDLVADLAAAETGRADLDEVLADVRVALSVE